MSRIFYLSEIDTETDIRIFSLTESKTNYFQN